MKQCEKCKFCFEEEAEFCSRCGDKLIEYTGPKKEKEFIISPKESSRRWCSVIRKVCYYAATAMLFAAIPISILYGWNIRDLTECVKLIMIFGLSAVVLYTLSCILECLIYIAFGSMYKKGEEEKEE